MLTKSGEVDTKLHQETGYSLIRPVHFSVSQSSKVTKTPHSDIYTPEWFTLWEIWCTRKNIYWNLCVFCKCIWLFLPVCACVCARVYVCASPRTGGLLYIAGGAAGIVFVWLRCVVHLSDDFGEQFIHHGLALGWGLDKGAAPFLSQSLTLAHWHLPLTLQIHLIAHQDHRHLLIPAEGKQMSGSGLLFIS